MNSFAHQVQYSRSFISRLFINIFSIRTCLFLFSSNQSMAINQQCQSESARMMKTKNDKDNKILRVCLSEHELDCIAGIALHWLGRVAFATNFATVL